MQKETDKPGPSKLSSFSKFHKFSEEELLHTLNESDSEFDGDESDNWEAAEDEDGDSACEEQGEERHEQQEEPEKLEDEGDVTWGDDPIDMVNHPFTKVESLLIKPVENTPIGFFRLLLTDQFLSKIVEETNNYATEIFLSERTKEESRITSWKDVTIEKLLVFLGVFLHMGNVKMRRLQDYWKKDPFFYQEAISKSISRNCFLLILRALHFSPNPRPAERNSDDRLYKIRSVIAFFNDRMAEVYYPGRELSLNESMVLWRGRLIFRQYIQNKRHKHGIKLYILATPAGVVLKCAAGILDNLGGIKHTKKVVFHLLQGKLNVGHHVYMDNYYNSFELASALLDQETHSTGMLRASRKNTPKAVQSAKLKNGETIAKYAKGIVIGKWKDKKEICYISSKFENNMIEVETRRKEMKSKPLPIANYNKFMSGIDRQDQMLSYYAAERKTIRWYKKLFLHMLEIIVFNSHALYNKYSGNKMPLYEFRLSIIKALLPSIETQRAVRNQQHIVLKRELAPEKKKISSKRCKLCSMEGRRTDTVYECSDCPQRPGYCLKCCNIYHK